MSKNGSRRLFIRVVCTDMYIDRQTGTRCARHQQFRLGRWPVFVDKDQDGNALPGTGTSDTPETRTLTHQPSVAQNAGDHCQGLRDTPTMRVGRGAASSGTGLTQTPNAPSLC
jgi:CO/xanthine dehydrogenase Mo-binding subunit